MRRFWRFGCTGVVLGCLAIGACSKEENPQVLPQEVVFPASWAGVWRGTFPYRDCPTDSLLGVDVTVDSICTGTTVEEFLGIREELLDIRCVGTITDTEFAAHCSGHSEFLGVSVAGDFTAVRDDSVFTGGGDLTVRYDDNTTECYQVSYDALRVAPAPPACSGAVSLVKPLARALRPRSTLVPRPAP